MTFEGGPISDPLCLPLLVTTYGKSAHLYRNWTQNLNPLACQNCPISHHPQPPATFQRLTGDRTSWQFQPISNKKSAWLSPSQVGKNYKTYLQTTILEMPWRQDIEGFWSTCLWFLRSTKSKRAEVGFSQFCQVERQC